MSLIALGLMAAALNVHGQMLSSACGKKPLPLADADLRKIVGTLLCAPDSPANRHIIANVLTRSARVHSDDLGEVTVSKVDMNTVLAHGKAWGLQVDCISGPATDNSAGSSYIESHFGTPAANGRNAAERLAALVEAKVFGAPVVREVA